MRLIHSDEIKKHVKEMCIEANYHLSGDVEKELKCAYDKEESTLGKKILGQLKENLLIAKEDQIPICQDTGMVTVFVTLGQEVHIEGGYIEDIINQGIREGYKEGYLRKSIVSDPINRVNTKDNTPGIIHYEIVPGEQFEITIAPKGFGSENMSRLYMLKPSDGIEGIINAVIETVKIAGPNACPPFIIGVGIGGNFEMCTYLAKKALARKINKQSEILHIRELEEELLAKVNQLGIGPGGFGGKVTALGVNIETYPTHIAGLPVAINMGCHVNRHITRSL